MKNGYPLEWGLWLNGRQVPRGMGLRWNEAPVELGPCGMKNGYPVEWGVRWNEDGGFWPLME